MFYYKAFDVNSIGYSHSHGEKPKPMQDSSLSINQEDYVIAVISDGHGSAPYLRSDRGSSIAVNVVSEMLESVYKQFPTVHDLNDEELHYYLEKEVFFILLVDLILLRNVNYMV